MELEIYQVDAFANAIFQGNPAAVCILDEWLPDFLLQAIAMEMNLSETAFAVKKDDGYRIRWFTPSREVKLCGHATLATAHVLFEHKHIPQNTVAFRSLSGVLTASKTPDGLIAMDFPANPPKPVPLTQEVADILGGNPVRALADDDLVVVYSDASEIGILTPDFRAMARLPYRGVVATAPGHDNNYDFVCRFFAPAFGIDEDPVTGSAFTELGPYYQEALGKNAFFAKQVSKRGGEVYLTVEGKRVHMSGRAKTVMHGTLFVADL